MAKYQKVFKFVAIISLILTMNKANAECCKSSFIEHDCSGVPGESRNPLSIIYDICKSTICLDGHPRVGFFCGRGSCNIFGCNCDGGCLNNNNPGNDWDTAENLFFENYENYF